MGLFKSLFQSFKSDNEAYEQTLFIHNALKEILSGKASLYEIDKAIMSITNDKEISENVQKALLKRFNYKDSNPSTQIVIDYNVLFDTVLEVLDKRAKNIM